MTARKVRHLHTAIRDDIGDLITHRPLPGPSIDYLDPWLFLNHHGPQVYDRDNKGLPFGPHPHRGFETVTFILDGSLAHADSGDHESIINAGGVQWMTAGSGLVHSEVSPEAFRREGGRMEILQLWLNLPAELKMTEPRYTGLQADELVQVELDDGRGHMTLIAGDFDQQGSTFRGPIETLTPTFMSVITIREGSLIHLPVPEDDEIFCYVVRGNIMISEQAIRPCHLIEFEQEGDYVEIRGSGDATLLFGHAPRLKEPMVSHGPFVMNTREEIEQAVDDYRNGRFGGLNAV
ncbi:pirin family protein [Kushneria konosiri]|uniref:Nuclease PIN n=1 Tax=Kushneria konosiri TaxID=698828 RepID=A0A2Z2H3L1_9GAMM|nr:pirin family protein [Kushneria konosiri]ARS51799.1 nuclease PIN [Kushneria konosiri]